MAWLMPHLIVNSSASIDMILTAWWIVFLTGFKYKWTCAIDIAMVFLILASETTTTDLESADAQKTYSSSLWMWVALLSLFSQFAWQNKK